MKKLFQSTLIICLILLAFSTVNASTFEFVAKADKEVVNPSDEVTVSMQINDIDTKDEGINVVEFDLEYDENIFESMNFIYKNDWEITYNDDKNSSKYGKTLIHKMVTGVNSYEEIGNIIFKLKDNLDEMETEIKLKSITSNDSNELIDSNDQIIKLKIINNKVTEDNDKTIDIPSYQTTQENNEKNINTSDPLLVIVFTMILVILSLNLVRIIILKKSNECN